jgi:hypothetical protein
MRVYVLHKSEIYVRGEERRGDDTMHMRLMTYRSQIELRMNIHEDLLFTPNTAKVSLIYLMSF